MRWLVLPLFLALLTSASAARAQETGSDTAADIVSNEPFRAVLILNTSIVGHAALTMSSIAKRPPPAKMPKAQRQIYEAQSKWLHAYATKLREMHARMEHVLAKGSGAPTNEIAEMNMEFVRMRDAIESESHRFDGSGRRNLAALKSLKH